ncbi:hypothetical protein LSTR_LSTR016935 [Laodelphax striatellus]|uniref:Uncharacterized protein n=1 Tax=Laodelphax striatellus TaxID=195883 RepID=A0A482WLL4_LAOST|nr:hypothetical protein LSTR_LSTR016935 [Laodelphax striatellus]
MTSFRQRSDAFASLPSQPVGREMCHACCSSQHSQSKAYSPHHSSEQSQSKKWRPGRRGAGEVVWTLVAVLAFVSSVGDAMPRRSVGPGAPEQDNKLMPREKIRHNMKEKTDRKREEEEEQVERGEGEKGIGERKRPRDISNGKKWRIRERKK